MDGILNVYKPVGPTSFKVVSIVKRLTGEKRVGHAGTLDPVASGVLPVCLGKATRITEYLMESTKSYLTEIELGKTTDTYDCEGKITSETDPSHVSRGQIETVIRSFHGEIQQTPPAYSALKYNGKPYYKLARAGKDFKIDSRPVTIHSIEIIDWNPPVVTIAVTCGKGTYIRSMAHDLGRVLGCGAYMKSLVRQNYGIFSVSDAVSLSELEQTYNENNWHKYIYPVDSVLSHLETIVVNDIEEDYIKHGRPLHRESESGEIDLPGQITGNESGTRCRVYNRAGRFLGILRYNREKVQWKPEKLFI